MERNPGEPKAAYRARRCCNQVCLTLDRETGQSKVRRQTAPERPSEDGIKGCGKCGAPLAYLHPDPDARDPPRIVCRLCGWSVFIR